MKLVIFDCDGTLVDSQHMIAAAMEAAFLSENIAAPAREDVLGVVGLSLTTAVARLLPLETGAPLIDRLSESYKAAFSEHRQRLGHNEPLYPGVRETLAGLAERDDVLLGIATGKSRRGVAAVLEREGLLRAFHTIQTADTHPSKPHPSMILAAMAETGAEPAETIMIGDTTFDVEMAVAAGVTALGVGWGYHPPEALRAAGAHSFVAHGIGLAPALAQWLDSLEKFS
jgi:phosphoglycolate phosphatase